MKIMRVKNSKISTFISYAISSHKNMEKNQSVFRSYFGRIFPKHKSVGAYFPIFLFAGFYFSTGKNTSND